MKRVVEETRGHGDTEMEEKGRKGERENSVVRRPALALPFPLSPLLPFSPPRRGVSLLEVLAAIGVLSIGLLGLAALLPIGRYTLGEATKADRAGQCGRAALRDVIIRRMLDSNPTTSPWTPYPNGNSLSFLIDPEGVSNGMNATFGYGAASTNTNVPRISLNYANTTALADSIFMATDDLVLGMPENMTPAQPIGRPVTVNYGGTYTWFLTVTPQPNNATRFTVSVVVCFNRNRTTNGERAVTVNQFYDSGLGGGSVQLARPINDVASDKTANTLAGIQIKENDWVALCNTSGLCRWYRVASVGDTNPTDTNTTPQYLTLIGPDWVATPGSDKLVALGQSVVGVYTTTIDLDTDPTWKN